MPDPAAPDDRPSWLREAMGQAGVPAGGSDQGVRCYRHPDREALLRCSRCNRPICGTCAQPAPVGQLCPDDARRTIRPRGLPAAGPPWVTWTILGTNLVFLLIEAALSGGGIGFVNPTGEALCRLGALNSGAIAESGQWWRLLTVMVLHGGVVHFAVNSWALWIFGPVLERVLGHTRFALLYVISGFVGSAASFSFRHTDLAVGASGAIFGLLGALIAFFWRRRGLPGSRAQLQSLLIVLAINLVLGVSIPGVDNLAHIGGLVGGFVTMALLDLAGRRRALSALVLAAPVLVGIVLVAWGTLTYPGGFNCVIAVG